MASFQSNLNITFIVAVTAILEINGVALITDPFFSPAGTAWDHGVVVLKNKTTPALGLQDLPVIDAVLLGHEDHHDNLDELGGRLPDGRKVLTRMDGAKNLAACAPRRPANIFQRGVYWTHHHGDLVWRDGWTAECDVLLRRHRLHGGACRNEKQVPSQRRLLNLGAASVPVGDPPLRITVDGKQAAKLFREIGADILVPMHCDGWGHSAKCYTFDVPCVV
ncbi:Uncharacterized protein TPAR_08667 [Tolypocladium paradoxum]|uniref:Metallo-beta-lactamase domain-containing protein n=1 Tax=Tolypocladium paradoxum TaxID=94208 RepID=A0A2S4KLN7_9HYPO|nr:Uncharacterized protein TPAR_08667 [Tolypocladium paradoxum]